MNDGVATAAERAPQSGQHPIPLSLYLHFPWCVRKCPYCDFNSHAARGELDEQAYVDALLRDLAYELEQAPETRSVQTIFMGGGTPSLFSGTAIGRLLEALSQRLNFAADIEITLEANPGTADAANFQGYRAAGVNRLSIGVQSLDAQMLKRLGRIHGPEDVRQTVAWARAAGFDNLNLDLMYALPEQTPEQAMADLDAAIALSPEHLSYYQLTLEPNTEFAAHPPVLPDDEHAWAMQLAGQARLAQHGYQQYEVSAYAQSGRQCRHNLNYWTYGDYLGLGAGAHAKRSVVEGQAMHIQRRARQKHPKRYLATAGSDECLQEQFAVAASERPFEFMMNALRLNQGFTARQFTQRTGLSLPSIANTLAQAQTQGLLTEDETALRPTELGRAHLNRLIGMFLPE